ncbi:MAG: tRNA (adenosine(37)-N6)-threonylcarbamoyltransferase complex ATPase subunit type 1 TsaE [Bacteroidales bacterium]|nr:tRNA (adenosine(37)-N6)-threonylcarbamoyltransferase complex ATPase subunit type 1 TsaE [Bacteroidales bacterium]
MKKELVIHSLDEIGSVARQFIQAIGNSRIISFSGKMGAGKTTFIKAVCEVLDVQDNVCSPTFAIVNVYESATVGEIYHFDFYRLTEPFQALDIGIEEYFSSGNYCFLEWAENIGEFIPQDCVFVEIIEQTDKSRKIIINLD